MYRRAVLAAPLMYSNPHALVLLRTKPSLNPLAALHTRTKLVRHPYDAVSYRVRVLYRAQVDLAAQ